MKNRLRVIFMGTPEFSVPSLKEISNHCDIISVYTQPPRGSGRGLKTKLSPIHILANKTTSSICLPTQTIPNCQYKQAKNFVLMHHQSGVDSELFAF